jgi:hypothetical protein
MGTLLSLIGKNKRDDQQAKNLPPTDDVTENGFSSYLDNYGRSGAIDYSDDTNIESPSVTDVGDIALRDLKELNLNPPDVYERVDFTYNDVSVIDMPEIDEISEEIYLGLSVYNKYATQDYTPIEISNAIGVQNQSENYLDSMNQVLSDLDSRGNTLADIFIGTWNKNDSKIGVIGGEALNRALNVQFADGVNRKILGVLNTNLSSLLSGANLTREDFSITVPKNAVARAAEFAIKLQGVELPFSYLPQDAFGLERIRKEERGKATYVGSDLSISERVNLLLEYTGKAQQKHLFNLLKLNTYHSRIEGRTETLEDTSYIGYVEGFQDSLNAKDFIATYDKIVTTEYGYYEPYGVVSIHKRDVVGEMFSDGFRWVWIDDIKDRNAIGWVNKRGDSVSQAIDSNLGNNFEPKSLLWKTQEILNGSSDVGAFLDLSKKEFYEVIDGETYVISRGDSTTASGDYTDDDGTEIKKGEFFRVFTKQRGYNKLNRTLKHRGLDNGDTRSVLNDNGLVNIAPTRRVLTDDVIKRYMFSLENLAWADHLNDLPECEQGPGDPVTGNRGRIMWFPPYNLEITESVSANYNDTTLIGRGEPIWTYNNTTRSASLSFTIIVDHPDIIHNLVGQKTQYWERYFKGDKLIEADAKAKQQISKRLSPNEIEEIEKRKKIVPVKEKVVDNVKVTPNEKNNEVTKKTNEDVNENKYGKLILSVYFPNSESIVPRSIFTPNRTSVASDSVPDLSISSSELFYKNVGYEDGGIASDFIDRFTTNDGYKIQTRSGIRYFNKAGVIVNKGYTYATYGNARKLIDNSFLVCKGDVDNGPIYGYKDRNNLGLNNKFYYEWQKVFNDEMVQKLKDGKKLKVSFIGNASAATRKSQSTETQYTNNELLSKQRADATRKWYEENVNSLFSALGVPTDGVFIDTSFQGDFLDRVQNILGIDACDECDETDKPACKQSRRVDIYIKDITDELNPPQPIIPSGQTIDDVIGDEEYTPDEDETNTDPNSDEPSEIDPNILKKLVYTECDFFEYLETNYPIAYQTISERIKFFSPAYHSITPQGFNSRLTFLHQCTRQGDSIGMDGVDNTKNLAFGRPPVCILRIGDFYHTRVIVKSLNIQYSEKMNWDLNPEGIGVQPMYADITMELELIGGSSMTAPINRLQNAMSFNFYANTEMYDARADSVVLIERYNKDGTVNEKSTFGTPKSGRIVDGVKLSSITNYSKSQQEAQLARIRKQSRITLDNSTTSLVPTNQISNLGEVESLLEMKKRLGLSMTSEERIKQLTSDSTKGKFTNSSVNPQTQKKVTDGLKLSLEEERSPINFATAQLIERGEENDVTSYIEILDSLVSAEVVDPNTQSNVTVNTSYSDVFNQYLFGTIGNIQEYNALSEEYKQQLQLEYIDSYNAIWLNAD